MKVYLIGVGPGGAEGMTLAARAAIDQCPVLIGAPRLLEGHDGKKCLPLIDAGDIAAAVRGLDVSPAAVLLSGDVGFYSGARRLYDALGFAELEVIPGVSSLVYLCARLRTPWQDVHAVSAHGRAHNAAGEIQCRGRTFVLTGGSYRAQDLARELCERGLGGVTLHVGERLSYPDERIVTGPACELAEMEFGSLAAVLAENPAPVRRGLAAPGLRDGDFERAGVPMTKEEVRALCICRLRLRRDDTVWDVGSGTGSVSAEAALAAEAGTVYAVEKKGAAAELTARNCARLGLTNVRLVEGEAPAALAELPAPDRVFLGGTSGSLEEILRLALEKNPAVRFVLTAVTLETLSEAVRCMEKLGLEAELVQLSATRTRRAGGYHLMDAQNPVWIISGEARHE